MNLNCCAMNSSLKWSKRILCYLIGHADRNHADEDRHYAYCIRCGKVFGHPWASERENKRAFDATVKVMRGQMDHLRLRLNNSLNAHQRNLQDATKAFSEDRGHVCQSRQTIEGIMQRSLQAIKEP